MIKWAILFFFIVLFASVLAASPAPGSMMANIGNVVLDLSLVVILGLSIIHGSSLFKDRGE